MFKIVKDLDREDKMKRLMLVLSMAILLVVGCAIKYPVVKPIYDKNNAAEITIIRYGFFGCGISMYIKMDGIVICELPKPGRNYTKLYIPPGDHIFEAIWGTSITQVSKKAVFHFEPNKKYYFQPYNSFWGVMYFFEITEVEARNLMSWKNYKYIPN